MRTNPKRRSSGIKWLLLAFFVIIFLVLMIILHGMEWALTRIAPPLANRISAQSQLKREKGEMALELDFLKKKTDELEIENMILKDELKTKSNGIGLSKRWADFPNIKSVVSRIILKDPAGLSTSFIIDAGLDKGIKKGMPVMGREALIGRVIEVHPSFSRVRTINGPKIAFGAIIQRTRELGVIVGSSDGPSLKYLSINADVKVGDDVVTSGTTDITPPGLFIGKVDEVVVREKDEELEARVKSTENINNLEFVRVVISTVNIPEGAKLKGGDDS